MYSKCSPGLTSIRSVQPCIVLLICVGHRPFLHGGSSGRVPPVQVFKPQYCQRRLGTFSPMDTGVQVDALQALRCCIPIYPDLHHLQTPPLTSPWGETLDLPAHGLMTRMVCSPVLLHGYPSVSSPTRNGRLLPRELSPSLGTHGDGLLTADAPPPLGRGLQGSM